MLSQNGRRSQTLRNGKRANTFPVLQWLMVGAATAGVGAALAAAPGVANADTGASSTDTVGSAAHSSEPTSASSTSDDAADNLNVSDTQSLTSTSLSSTTSLTRQDSETDESMIPDTIDDLDDADQDGGLVEDVDLGASGVDTAAATVTHEEEEEKDLVSGSRASATTEVSPPANLTIPVQRGPSGIAASGNTLYVTNTVSNSMSIIDAVTNVEKGTIPVNANGPVAVGTLGTTTYAYVTGKKSLPEWGPSQLSVIDTNTKQLVDTIALTGRPTAVAVSGNGARIYVTTDHGPLRSILTVIDAESRKVIGSMHIAGDPTGLAVDPVDGSIVYISQHGPFLGIGSGVLKVDTVNSRQIGRINTGGTPNAIAVASDGKTVYAAKNRALPTGSYEVWGINTDSFTATSKVTLAGRSDGGLDLSPDDKTLLVTATQNTGRTGATLIKIDPPASPNNAPTMNIAGTVQVGPPRSWLSRLMSRGGAAADAQLRGAVMYYSNPASRSVSVVEVDRSQVPIAARIGGLSNPSAVAVSPDGAKVFVANKATNSISIFDANTNLKIKDISLRPNIDPVALAISPDNSHLYVLNAGQIPSPWPLAPPKVPTVSIINIATGKIDTTEISTLHIFDRIPNFISPAVTGMAIGANQIYITDITTRTPSFTPIANHRWQLMEVTNRLVSDGKECKTPKCPVYNDLDGLSTWKTVYVSKDRAFWAVQKGINAMLYGVVDVLGMVEQPRSIAVAPGDGNGYIYSINSGNGFAYVFDPRNNVMVDAVFLGKMSVDGNQLKVDDNNMPTAISFRPDGKTAYVTNAGSREVVVLDTDPEPIAAGLGSRVIARIPIVGADEHYRPTDIAVSPDGKYGYVISNRFDPDRYRSGGESTLTVIDLATNTIVGGKPFRLGTDNSKRASKIAVSNNNAYIAIQPDSLVRSTVSNWIRGKEEVLVVDLTKLLSNLGQA